MLKLKTTRFVKVLKWLDRKFALNGAKNYALSNSKLTLSRDEALTFNYSWRVWRWMQFAETGVFWQGSQTSSIYQRTLEDLTAECQALFKQDPPLLTNPIWNPYTMVKELTIPLIYVNGGKDPWKGVCLPEDFKIDKGQYLLFSEAKHCPDVLEKEYGEKVFIAVRQYLFSKKD